MFTFDIAKKRVERLFFTVCPVRATPIEDFNVALTATVSRTAQITAPLPEGSCRLAD